MSFAKRRKQPTSACQGGFDTVRRRRLECAGGEVEPDVAMFVQLVEMDLFVRFTASSAQHKFLGNF